MYVCGNVPAVKCFAAEASSSTSMYVCMYVCMAMLFLLPAFLIGSFIHLCVAGAEPDGFLNAQEEEYVCMYVWAKGWDLR